MEYQGKAEELVRELHKQSLLWLGAAGAKADAIGRQGSEMTKRRIIQSALLDVAHSCDEARKSWLLAARDVVPANNLELKALRNAINDLTPRIERRRESHRAKLVEHLGKVRADEWVAREQQLRSESADATRRHQELSEQFLKVDSALSEDDRQAEAELRDRRDAIRVRMAELAELERDVVATGGQIEILRAGRPVDVAGTVSYQSLAPILPSRFDLEKSRAAVGLGGILAGMFMFGTWLLSRPRRPVPGGTS